METYTEIINGQEVTIKRYAEGTRSSKKSKPIKELFPKPSKPKKQGYFSKIRRVHNQCVKAQQNNELLNSKCLVKSK